MSLAMSLACGDRDRAAGIDNPLGCAAATGLANLVGTFLGMKMVDNRGRRDLLIKGAFGMAVCMFLAALLLLGCNKRGHFVAVMFIWCVGPVGSRSTAVHTPPCHGDCGQGLTVIFR